MGRLGTKLGIEWPAIDLLPSERDASTLFLRHIPNGLPFEYKR